MFGLFASKCPLGIQEKTWIERRMKWLVERFGLDRMKNATVVTPTSEFFPDPYTPDEAGFRHTLRRVCGYMGVDPNSIRFALADDAEIDAAGLYVQQERSVIYVARSMLEDPTRLIATLAHELAHELLLKGGHISREVSDHEEVTDLLPVFLGLGIFGANATIRDSSWSSGQWSGWQVNKQGYLSSLQLGYALAVFAHARGETRPKWVKHLRTDAGVVMKSGFRYLRSTGDTLFRPTASARRGTPSELADELGDTSPTVRLNALLDVHSLVAPPAELLLAVEPCLRHNDPGMRLAALRAVGRFGGAAGRLAPLLIDAIFHAEPSAIRVEAAYVLGEIEADPIHAVPALSSVIASSHPELVAAAADSLASFGRHAAPAEPKLMVALEAAGHLSDEHRVASLVAALLAAVPDASAKIKERFNNSDPDLRRVVIGELLRQTR